jgi:hypothetical protein
VLYFPTRKQWRLQKECRGKEPKREIFLSLTCLGANGRIDPVGNQLLKDFRCNFQVCPASSSFLSYSLFLSLEYCAGLCCAPWPPAAERDKVQSVSVRSIFGSNADIYIYPHTGWPRRWLTTHTNYTCTTKSFFFFWFFSFGVLFSFFASKSFGEQKQRTAKKLVLSRELKQ